MTRPLDELSERMDKCNIQICDLSHHLDHPARVVLCHQSGRADETIGSIRELMQEMEKKKELAAFWIGAVEHGLKELQP